MITDIKFGKSKGQLKKAFFYVWHNLSGTTLIGQADDWLDMFVNIEAILSHETLHKVIFKLEGGKASTALDKWCRSRKWCYNDDSGVCFVASEMEED